MRNFIKIASGVEVLPLAMELYRQPELWNQHTARTGGAGSFVGTDDIWLRFRAPDALTSREAFAEEFRCQWYLRVARAAAPSPDRSSVWMSRVEAVELAVAASSQESLQEAR